MKHMRYKPHGRVGLFDEQMRLEQLAAKSNPLKQLSSVIDFEIFSNTLEDAVLTKEKRNNAGAKPYDVVILFKILILQRYFGLSDEQVEYQIIDRTSFREFLGFASGDKIPDEKTVWAFRERLTRTKTIEKLFILFGEDLKAKCLIINDGKMVDASFAPVPIQRNTPEENKKIKDGESGDLWNDEPTKKKHKDTDARWTKKGGKSYFGYKNHAKVDANSKLIDTLGCN